MKMNWIHWKSDCVYIDLVSQCAYFPLNVRVQAALRVLDNYITTEVKSTMSRSKIELCFPPNKREGPNRWGL